MIYKVKKICEERNISYLQLQKDCKIMGRDSMALSKGLSISLEIVDRICSYLKCQPSEIMELGKEKLPWSL